MALPRAKLTKIVIDELAAVDEGAQGVQGTVLLKRAVAPVVKTMVRVAKQAVLTDEVDGHQHTIDLNDPACWYGTLSTSYQMSEGAENGHSHAWTFDNATGSVTIAADSGHTHTVTGIVSPITIAAAAAIDATRKAEQLATATPAVVEITDAIPVVLVDEPSSAKIVVNVTQRKSPPAIDIAKLSLHPEAMSMKPIVLTDSQFAHYSKLSGADADAFVAKSHADRESDVAKAIAADPVMYTTTNGVEIRKSAGDLAVMFAKQADESAKKIASQETEIAKANTARETEMLKGRAMAELKNGSGSIDTKVALLKAIAAIPDEATRTAVTETVKGMHAACADKGVLKGSTDADGTGGGDPLTAFNVGVAKFAETNGIKDKGEALEKFLVTPEGKLLKKSYDATRAYTK